MRRRIRLPPEGRKADMAMIERLKERRERLGKLHRGAAVVERMHVLAIAHALLRTPKKKSA